MESLIWMPMTTSWSSRSSEPLAAGWGRRLEPRWSRSWARFLRDGWLAGVPRRGRIAHRSSCGSGSIEALHEGGRGLACRCCCRVRGRSTAGTACQHGGAAASAAVSASRPALQWHCRSPPDNLYWAARSQPTGARSQPTYGGLQGRAPGGGGVACCHLPERGLCAAAAASSS